MKHVGMSRSATLTTRNDARRRLKPPKVTSLATVPIGTAIWSCCERLPRRWRMVADTKAASSEHCSTPRTPKSTRTLRYAFGEKSDLACSLLVYFLGSGTCVWINFHRTDWIFPYSINQHRVAKFKILPQETTSASPTPQVHSVRLVGLMVRQHCRECRVFCLRIAAMLTRSFNHR